MRNLGGDLAQQLQIVLAALDAFRVQAQQQRVLWIPYHQFAVAVEQRKAVAHGVEGGFQLGAFLF